MIDVRGMAPIGHDEAMRLQTTEFDRTVELLRTLTDEQWRAPVAECPGWDVLTMYRHVLGASEAGASMRENVHQMRAALAHRRQHGGPLEAALTAVQTRERADLDAAAVLEGLATVGPRCVRGRSRVPGPARRLVRTKVDGPVVETWALGYLIDTVYLRDLWMHRIDAARAVGREPTIDAEHDGRIVADVVAEWARRHGSPFVLTLTGPAGGTYRAGEPSEDTDPISMDAVQFCRTLSGRAEGDGLLSTVVPF